MTPRSRSQRALERRKDEAASPKPRRGVCRKCGCTDNSACEYGCAWVDDAHTLCSACAYALDALGDEP